MSENRAILQQVTTLRADDEDPHKQIKKLSKRQRYLQKLVNSEYPVPRSLTVSHRS